MVVCIPMNIKNPILFFVFLFFFRAEASPFQSDFTSTDEAARAFVHYVRSLADSSRKEYCTYIVQKESNRYQLLVPSQGNESHCSLHILRESSDLKIVGNIHTHPTMFGGSQLSAIGQLPSKTDFLFAQSQNAGGVSYLGAPAGHIVKYLPTSISCRGRSWVRYSYQLIQRPFPNAMGTLPFQSDQWIVIPPEEQGQLCK